MAETIGEHKRVDDIDGKKVCRDCGQTKKTCEEMRAVDCSDERNFDRLPISVRPAGWG